LTVDGKSLTQPLEVAMDPRSSATSQELEEQLKLGQRIFVEALASLKTVAAVNAVQATLTDLGPKLAGHADLEAGVTQAKAKIKEILSGNAKDSHAMGLEAASAGLTSVLRVVESSDRTIPAQAVEAFHDASAAMKTAADQWAASKTSQLSPLNEQLKQANFQPIPIAEVESTDENLSH
jgi:hypothetical protein